MKGRPARKPPCALPNKTVPFSYWSAAQHLKTSSFCHEFALNITFAVLGYFLFPNSHVERNPSTKQIGRSEYNNLKNILKNYPLRKIDF